MSLAFRGSISHVAAFVVYVHCLDSSDTVRATTMSTLTASSPITSRSHCLEGPAGRQEFILLEADVH